MSGYVLHPAALQELEDIRKYIAADSRDAADRLVDEVFDSIAALVSFPHRGARRPDLTSRPLRFLWVREYLIAYAPDTHPLRVLTVVHGRRSPRVIAVILRGRK